MLFYIRVTTSLIQISFSFEHLENNILNGTIIFFPHFKLNKGMCILFNTEYNFCFDLVVCFF